MERAWKGRGWGRKVTHVPHPRHAPSERGARTVYTRVPALIRHRTTRVTAPLYTASL